MKVLGNILAIAGIVIFIGTIISRLFVGDDAILGSTGIASMGTGMTASGMFSGVCVLLLLSVIAILNSKQ